MRKAGSHDTVTMAVTGHTSREMFDRYNTVDEDEKSAAVEAMEKSLAHQKKKINEYFLSVVATFLLIY